MAEIVNLRQVRKRKAKEADEKVAAQNRTLFGRTKAEKKFETAVSRKAERFLDDRRLEKPTSDKLGDK
ncbi:DUF4169 family protein [Phyllobacterium sp. SB3]|uniref:DUF4169 family protein n=1 Tax=Phyllobacterium sp. SB3 TaxID=3156073 RepID=UPI0032AEAB6B